MYNQKFRRIIRRVGRGLGELPADYYRTGPMIDPTAGLALDWDNRYKTLQFGAIVGVAEVNILQGNSLRTYLLIQNQDLALDVFVGFGTSAGGINGALIIPRGFGEFIGGEMGGCFCPPESINIICPGGNARINIVEGSLNPYETEQF